MKSCSGFSCLAYLVEGVVELGGFLGRAGDDQGRPGLVDEDGVHFVDDGIVEVPLDVILQGEFHVVPEIVEPEFVVGAVGDVRAVGPAALVVVQAVDDGAHREPQETVDAPHPVGVPAGQVVVDRDDVDPAAGEGVEVGGHGGHQGFAFTGLHFGDFALVQHDAADDLDVEGAHPQDPGRGLPGRGKGLGQQVVQGFVRVQALLEEGGFGLELGVGQVPEFRLQVGDAIHQGRHALQFPVVFTAEYFFRKRSYLESGEDLS